MENISNDKNDNKKNFPKLSLNNKFKSKKNIQIKLPFFTEAFSINNKNKNEFLSPIKTETIIMNSYSLNNKKIMHLIKIQINILIKEFYINMLILVILKIH